MPRTSTDSDQPRKRAVRKRATRSTAGGRVASKSTAKKPLRRRVTRGSARAVSAPEPSQPKPKTERVTSESNERKAPTAIAARKAKLTAKRKQLITVVVVFIVGVGASAAIGFTDSGEIDVGQRIEDRNERIRSGQFNEGEVENQRIVVPVQDTPENRLPNGGFIPAVQTGTPAPPPAPTPEVATSSATSTDETATTTSELVEDVPSDNASSTASST